MAPRRIEKDPHSWADLTQGITETVELSLRVDFASKRLEGSAVLRFREPLRGGPLDLDSRALEVTACADPETKRALPFEVAAGDAIRGERIRVECPKGLAALEVRYRTSPQASALQWLSPAQTAGKRHPYLFSQCQAIHARSIAPLQDTPAARIRYTAAIDVPAELTALMSANTTGETVTGARKVVRFEMPQPIPPYLLALAVGDVTSRDLSKRSRVWAEKEVVDAAAREFEDVEKMMLAAEALFGPYDWDRYDMLVMPPSFPYGGMENPRLTFLTPTLIAGDKSLVDVVAHELAHSWTGNLVSNASANDFWLNEGFTVYAERRIQEAIWGADHTALKSALGRVELDNDVNRFGADSPYTKLRTELAGVDPDEVFSLVPYEKGYLFLVLLERTAGRAKFDEFLKAWLGRFRFQSVTTEDFEETIEKHLPGLLAKVGAREWIDGAGVPANAPAFSAPRLDALRALAHAWKEGKRPDVAEAKKWDANEWHLFLRELPQALPMDDCAWLDSTFALTKATNMEVLVSWLTIAAASGYAPARPRTREVLHSVGRMRYLKPLYRALASRAETLAFAKETFASAEPGYHSIAAGGIKAILENPSLPRPD